MDSMINYCCFVLSKHVKNVFKCIAQTTFSKFTCLVHRLRSVQMMREYSAK